MRLIADRRAGIDRRETPRRYDVSRPSEERRATVDRRRGSERRSTLDRRGHTGRQGTESPGEHLRNALQLLGVLHAGELDGDQREDLIAALERVRHALRLLEPKDTSSVARP